MGGADHKAEITRQQSNIRRQNSTKSLWHVKQRQETTNIPTYKCKRSLKYPFKKGTQESLSHLLKMQPSKMLGLPVSYCSVLKGRRKESPCSVGLDLEMESSSPPAELSCCNSRKLF